MKEDDLEFISVAAEDDTNSMNQTYADTPYDDGGSSSTVFGNSFFRGSKHPVTIFFHLAFKAAALFMYMFGSWLTSSFIFVFVVCVILLAFDFWTVKNVSGRLLVGLRWWSYVKDDGSNEWIFESLEDMAEISATDSRIFWGALYINPLCWALLFVVGILRLKFEYLPIVVAAIVMNFANLMGYFKCSSSAKDKMRSMVEAGMKQGSLAALENSSLRNWVISSLLSTGGPIAEGVKAGGGGAGGSNA